METFRRNYHVLEFSSATVQTKYHALGFHELFSKKLQKVSVLVKNQGKLTNLLKLGTFRANYHVLAFSSTFEQKPAKGV